MKIATNDYFYLISRTITKAETAFQFAAVKRICVRTESPTCKKNTPFFKIERNENYIYILLKIYGCIRITSIFNFKGQITFRDKSLI